MNFLRAKSSGDDYYHLLDRLHKLLQPRVYVEIGVRSGQSFALARSAAHALGIDPAPDIQFPLRTGARVFKMTSDDFFAAHNLHQELDGQPVDLAFVDGMHLFEFALRDFINLEKYASPASAILVHDCYPIDAASADRERTTQIWSGDVWKLLLCLKKYRPDLDLVTVDTPPTGLGIIRNLNPGSTVLRDSLDKICQEFMPCEFERIAGDRAAQLNRIDNDWSKIRPLFSWATEPTILSRLTGLGSRRPQNHSVPPAAAAARRPARASGVRPKFLGVLLCYNDADILPDAMEALLEDNHDLIVWDHGSDDGTAEVLDRYAGQLLERKLIPRSFDFYRLHEAMSRNLIQNYRTHYDWISWPDQDEILEGPARDRRYSDYLAEAVDSRFNWIQFRNFNYWFTSEDDETIVSPVKRVCHYSLYPNCAPRIRAWRASVTNIRYFNHNELPGAKFPRDFNLRHYPMRSRTQMLKRLHKDRADVERGSAVRYYNLMRQNLPGLVVPPGQLHRDDGSSELDGEAILDWKRVYFGPGGDTGKLVPT